MVYSNYKDLRDNSNLSAFINDIQKEAEPIIKAAKVANCDRLNLRARPDFSAPILTTLTEGTRINITEEPNEKFYAIETLGGIKGYCAKTFVKILDGGSKG